MIKLGGTYHYTHVGFNKQVVFVVVDDAADHRNSDCDSIPKSGYRVLVLDGDYATPTMPKVLPGGTFTIGRSSAMEVFSEPWDGSDLA